MDTPDLVVSLGPNCRNTWNLRQFFSFERAYPLDWWITPVRSMLNLIEQRKEFHVTRDDLIVSETRNGSNTVYNIKLNLTHHHDFDRANRLVQEISSEAVDRLNSKYQYLFSRFWEDLEQVSRPLLVMNGIMGGFEGRPEFVAADPSLNGSMSPEEVIGRLREALGEKSRVLIIDVGEESDMEFEGGRAIWLPDRGKRENMESRFSYAEPVHVFREAYARAGLTGVHLDAEEDLEPSRLRISNNTPRMRPPNEGLRDTK